MREQGRQLGELLALSAHCATLRTQLRDETRVLTSLDLSSTSHIAPPALAMLAKDTATLTRLALLTCSHDRIADDALISEFARNNPSLKGTSF